MTLLHIDQDKILLDWFKDNHGDIKFIGSNEQYPSINTSINSTEELINKLKPNIQLHKSENIETLIDLWKNLIGDSIIYLKSKDAREKYHDGETFGIDKLQTLLKEFRKFEKLLYGATEHYRDHIAHVFRVFLIGEYLIKNTYTFDAVEVNDDDIPEQLKIEDKFYPGKIQTGEKEAMWCIIALTHDLGYALEKIGKINSKVREMIQQYGNANIQELSFLFPPQRQNIDDFVIKYISSNIVKKNGEYATHIQSKYYLKFASAFEKYDHGVISCTVLMRSLVYFLESDYLMDSHKLLKAPDARHFLIRQNILRAIASHNCDDIYHLKCTNFPFLLLIFDEIQEWGRPRLQDIFKREQPQTEVFIETFEKDEIEYKVRFKCSSANESEKEAMIEEVKNYFVFKSKKFITVLRSAVDGANRKISITFKVDDEINNPPLNYVFILKQPHKDSEMLKPKYYKNNDEITLQDL